MSENSRPFCENKKIHYVSLIFDNINAPLYFLAICKEFARV